MIPDDAGRPTTVLLRGGCPVHAWVDGGTTAPMVVLLHGAGMDHRMFDAQVGPLLAAGYRVMTLDQRGHGRSRPLGEVPLSVADLAGDVLALADEVAAPRLALVGQSLGGFVAQHLAVHHPERVTTLVTIGSSCTTTALPPHERYLLRSSLTWFRYWPWQDLRRRSARATAVTPAAQAYAHEAMGLLTKEDFLQVWRAVTEAIQPVAGHRAVHPLLLTHGDRDNTGTVRKSVATWAAQEPGATYVVVPDAGHNANQDNPEHVNRVLLDHLQRYVPVGGAA